MWFTGVTPAPLGLTGAMVPYLVTDALEEDAGSRFRRGDEVRFQVSRVYNSSSNTWTHATVKVESRSTVAPHIFLHDNAGFETSSRPYLLKHGAPCHPDVLVR